MKGDKYGTKVVKRKEGRCAPPVFISVMTPLSFLPFPIVPLSLALVQPPHTQVHKHNETENGFVCSMLLFEPIKSMKKTSMTNKLYGPQKTNNGGYILRYGWYGFSQRLMFFFKFWDWKVFTRKLFIYNTGGLLEYLWEEKIIIICKQRLVEGEGRRRRTTAWPDWTQLNKLFPRRRRRCIIQPSPLLSLCLLEERKEIFYAVAHKSYHLQQPNFEQVT